MSELRFGIITQYWLPKFGGAEQYTHRLAQNLVKMGIDVRIFAGTATDPDKDNGDMDVTRYTPKGNIEMGEWGQFQYAQTQSEKEKSLKQIFNLYDFMNKSVEWAKAQSLDAVIVNHPLTLISQYQTRELVLQLKCLGIKVGVIHHDNHNLVEDALTTSYTAHNGWGAQGWNSAADNCMIEMLPLFFKGTKLESYYRIGSPLFFQPDFVISNSHWSNRFIDPLEEANKIVVHPVVDKDYWTGPSQNATPMKPVDILMVNPQNRKGPGLMANLIRNAHKDWTFRILKGGWGNSFETFIPMIEDSTAFKEGRVDLCTYVADMRDAYDACKIVFFPSLYEGYGLTAVEPIYRDVPVVSSSYPAILEATGTDAPSLCPFKDLPFKWTDLVSEVLSDRDQWVLKARKRMAELETRHNDEMMNLFSFLNTICHKDATPPRLLNVVSA